MAVAKIARLNLKKLFINSRCINKAYSQDSDSCNSSDKKPDWLPKQIETHTHQKWDDDDYRNVRFIDKPKHVNQNFAIECGMQVPDMQVEQGVLWCDGGGPGGHPKVFLNMDKPGIHACWYCGRHYMAKGYKHL